MKILGTDLDNPLILCSGVLGISAALFKRLEDAGIGGVVTKSISLQPNEGYDTPAVAKLPVGVLNSMGLPNPGIDAFLEEIDGLDLNIPLIISIYGGNAEEFSEVAKRIGTSCDAIELNLSCPHAGKLLAIGQDPSLVYDVVHKVKKSASVPIIAKLTPNVNDITEIGIQAQNAGADAISAINTVKGISINIAQRYPVLSNIYGGLSGPAIKPIGVRCVWDLAGALDIPIIGIGGIETSEDVVEYLYAGASAVQLGTVLGEQGIEHITMIKNDFESFCRNEKKEYPELIGLVRRQFP